MTQLTSSSSLGNTQITIQFDLSRDIDAAAQDVQSAITAAAGQLPKNLPNPPTYRKVNPADPPILVLSVRSDTLPITQVDDYAENMLALQISQVPGVAQVSIGGQQQPAVRVQVDPAKLAAKGLTLEDVRGVIAAGDASMQPRAPCADPKQSFTIYDNDQLTKAAPYNDLIITYRNGAPVRVRDIGEAVDGPADTTLAAWINGRRAIALIVSKQPGANVIDTVDRIKAELPRLTANLPPSIEVTPVVDRTTTIRASVRDVAVHTGPDDGPRGDGDLRLPAQLALDDHSRAWPCRFRSSAHSRSCMRSATASTTCRSWALTIAVGFVVDDAIVVLENIERHIEEGLPPLQAALKGAGEIGFTVLSISLSLVAVFIPLLFMSGIVGRLLREFAVTVTVSILVSVVVSLTLTPDAGEPVPEAEAPLGRAGPALSGERARLRGGGRRLRENPGRGAAPSRADASWLHCDARGHRLALSGDSERLLPDPGYRRSSWVRPKRRADVSPAEMARLQQELAGVVAGDPDVAQVVSVIGGCAHGQSGTDLCQPEAARPGPRERHGDREPPSTEARPGCRARA